MRGLIKMEIQRVRDLGNKALDINYKQIKSFLINAN